jgi:hypothetical protein
MNIGQHLLGFILPQGLQIGKRFQETISCMLLRDKLSHLLDRWIFKDGA